MDDQNNILSELSLIPRSVPLSKISDKIKFAYPQSSVVIIGDHYNLQTLPTLFENAVKDQFEYGLYLCQDHLRSDFIQSIREDGGLLYRVRARNILNNNIESDTLLELYKKHKRVIISVRNVSQNLRIQYWKMLNMQIRTFLSNKKASKLPYFTMWIDDELSSNDPLIFEHFRILGLWGDEYGLRFTIILDKYSVLSSPARTLFGIIMMLPGLSMNEFSGIIDNLTIENSLKNQLYKIYRQMDYQKLLIVSPIDMFPPFLVQSGL